LRVLGLCLVCSLMPAKTVLTLHAGGYASSPQGRRARAWGLTGFVLRRFDRVIGVNQEMLGLFERLGLARHKIRLIAPYVLPSQLPEAELPESLARFVEAHRPLLVTVGLLEPEYDLPQQIGILGRVRKRFPGAGLAIIGSGSLEDDLRRLIEAQPWAGHIALCGDVEHAATLRAMATADVVLRTTLHDGDSVAVREALHLGKAVVATDDRMRPPGTILIPTRDPDALCRAIEQCLAAPGGPAAASSESTPDQIAAVLALYEELAAENRGATLAEAATGTRTRRSK
jgi:glycogen(starch) synthase